MTTDHGRTAVYRCYDAAGILLYIGSSNNPKARYSEHACSALKPWWPTVARKDETWYEKRSDAQKAEAEAVRAEAPLHNVRLQADAKTTIICMKVSEAEAAAIDAARGELSRSAWCRDALLAAVHGDRPPPARQRRPERAKPSPAPLQEAAAEPRRRCTHPGKRSVGGWCKDCDHLILTGGMWA